MAPGVVLAATRERPRIIEEPARGSMPRLVRRLPIHLKSLLYAYRVALTGIHALRTGEIESGLRPLCLRRPALEFIEELIEKKRRAETGGDPTLDRQWHLGRLAELEAELDRAYGESVLPEAIPLDEVHAFLVAEGLVAERLTAIRDREFRG